MNRYFLFSLFLAIAPDFSGAVPEKISELMRFPDQVPAGLERSDWASIRAAYEAERHVFRAVEDGWQARNPGQQWLTSFDGRGFITEPVGGAWQWGLNLRSYGFPGHEHVIGGVPSVQVAGQRLTYGWGEKVNEWFVNDARGLEHGFTVHERPMTGADPAALLQFDFAVRGSLTAQVREDGQGVEFRDAAGEAVLHYVGLKVWDADGRVLAARFVPTVASAPRALRLVVEETAARYPLTIDPIAQQAYLKASNTEANDYFGYSVAVSGDTVVIGAPFEDSNATGVGGNQAANSSINSGAAYVFTRSGASWRQQAYLKASNTGAGDEFGFTVAVSGDTVVVGAFVEASSATGVGGNQTDNSLAHSGAAYVFTRSGAAWTQQAYLKASNTGANDVFGYSVAVSGNTVVVGALGEASNASGVGGAQTDNSSTQSGAAYIFTRSGTTWTQQAYLKANNTGASDKFGIAVAVAGDTVVVGAPYEDGSATDSGAAYVFSRNGSLWTQQAFLKASNTGASDLFGEAVAVSGDTAVVGAYQEDSNATGVGGSQSNDSATNSGAAYIFTRNETAWTQQAYLKASNTGGGDQFGDSVAVSGDAVVVGAGREDSNALQEDDSAGNSGAAYVFARSGAIWTQQTYLKSSNTGADDLFGSSVAASGNTMVIGAHGEASKATGVDGIQTDNSQAIAGAAFVFIGLGPVIPEIAVEQPEGLGLVDGSASVVFSAPPGSAPQLFTIRNTGTADLTGLVISIDGVDAGSFTVDTTAMINTVSPGGSTTFTVTGISSGTRAAVLHIASNDADENPFDITLVGQFFSSTTDSDGDGLNDLAELQYAPLGFDWKVKQLALVATLNSSANTAGLYTPSQVQALNVPTPLLTKDATTGAFKLTIGVEKSTDLTIFSPFPMTVPQTTINGQGELEFLFTPTDNAAFFRLETQ
jgi:hypothetical protein